MFDCHGTIDQYCWDGGNTWVVGGEPEGPARRFSEATVTVATDLLDAMRPGVRISGLLARALSVYRRAGSHDPHAAVVFFPGLGLSPFGNCKTPAVCRPNTS